MGITTMRRTGAFFVVLSLLASVFVIIAPAAFSQQATVTVGECVEGEATVSVQLSGTGEWSFLAFDGEGVELGDSYTNESTHSFSLSEGNYDWIVYETSDEDKEPLLEGSFVIDCDAGEETTTTSTTVPEETTSTTVPEETTSTTVPEETTSTTVPEETTTTTSTPSTTVSEACVAEIGDLVWIDANENGVQDPGEEPVPGVTVHLLDENGDVVATTVTDSEGRYRFGGLCDGVYRIQFELPDIEGVETGWTEPGVGADDDADSNADANGLTAEITVVDGTADVTWDAGIVLTQVDPTTTVQEQTTSTSVPPVTASTLPFTGLESAELAVMGGLASIFGMGMLLMAGRTGRRAEDTVEGGMGRW